MRMRDVWRIIVPFLGDCFAGRKERVRCLEGGAHQQSMSVEWVGWNLAQ